MYFSFTRCHSHVLLIPAYQLCLYHFFVCLFLFTCLLFAHCPCYSSAIVLISHSYISFSYSMSFPCVLKSIYSFIYTLKLCPFFFLDYFSYFPFLHLFFLFSFILARSQPSDNNTVSKFSRFIGFSSVIHFPFLVSFVYFHSFYTLFSFSSFTVILSRPKPLDMNAVSKIFHDNIVFHLFFHSLWVFLVSFPHHISISLSFYSPSSPCPQSLHIGLVSDIQKFHLFLYSSKAVLVFIIDFFPPFYYPYYLPYLLIISIFYS